MVVMAVMNMIVPVGVMMIVVVMVARHTENLALHRELNKRVTPRPILLQGYPE